MSVNFEDYYAVLGVDRGASQDDIQRAFRKKARLYHPDVSKEPDAEETFKKVNEAYEVLKDPERRRRYDALGSNWKAGQEFRPPPGFEGIFGGGGPGGPGGFGGGFDGAGGFSDFFNTLFGGRPGGPAGGPGPRGFSGGFGPQPTAPRRGNQEVDLKIALEDVYHNVKRQLRVPVRVGGGIERRSYSVKIPKGAREGTAIRLANQAPSGDLILRLSIEEDPRFRVEGHDLHTTVGIAPWEAALGAKITIRTVDGEVKMRIPAGVKSGSKLRLKGKGLTRESGERAALYAHLELRNPPELTERERELYAELAQVSSFDPRADG